MSRTSAIFSPDFQTHERAVTASMGLTPGFNNQFHYLDFPPAGHPLHSRKELVYNWMVTDPDVKQVEERHNIGGEYQSMVPDFPFDPIGESQLQENLLTAGFGSILLGLLTL